MSRTRIALRFQKGGLVPADQYSVDLIRQRGYRVGDMVFADLAKPRNPKFFRLAHAFGKLCAENIEDFQELDAHTVLKRIQIEGNIACDSMRINHPIYGPIDYRQPKSLAFESMDEGVFTDVFKRMCEYIARTYWPDCTAEQIAAMAETMPEAA